MVKEIKWPQLKTYELKPYFWLDDAAQEVIFRAPVGGKTTPNSVNPRSELRQMTNAGENAAWSNKTGTWTLNARMRFRSIPTSSDPTRACVGIQIHDGNDDVTVLRLEKNGDLWVTQGDNTHYDLVNGSYVMGTFMNIRLRAVKGGGIQWFINNMVTPVSTLPGTFSGCYFKAGCYTQGTPSNSTGYGETGFTSLTIGYQR